MQSVSKGDNLHGMFWSKRDILDLLSAEPRLALIWVRVKYI